MERPVTASPKTARENRYYVLRRGNSGIVASRPTSINYPPGHLGGQGVHGPTENCDGHHWRSAHRVNITDRIRRGDAPESLRIIHDRQEEISRTDHAGPIAQVVDGRIIPGIITDEEARKRGGGNLTAQNPVQNSWRDFTTAART